MDRRSSESCQDRYDPPSDQYPSKPDSRTELVQQQVARDLKNEIAEKEYSRDESKLLACDRQFFVHGQCRKSDIKSDQRS
jgi:hypothetical protein